MDLTNTPTLPISDFLQTGHLPLVGTLYSGFGGNTIRTKAMPQIDVQEHLTKRREAIESLRYHNAMIRAYHRQHAVEAGIERATRKTGVLARIWRKLFKGVR